ncbi:MAG: hypothetical protein IJD65_04575 [Mailhella sp.]|nr:hypothetical protein [Mailhella sp.]
MERRTDTFNAAPRGKLDLSSDSERLKNMFRSNLSKEADLSWLSPLSFSQGTAGSLAVHLPHELFFRWFSDTGRALLEKAVRETLGPLKISYEWPGRPMSAFPLPSPLHPSPSAASSFDDFISGGKNREALHLFRRSLHAQPGPLFLHGPSGTGKTHLLQAAYDCLEARFPGKNIFLSCRELISFFRRSPEQARNALLSCSSVIVDDIQELENDACMQKELASLIDSMDAFFIASCQTDGNGEHGQKLLPLLYDRLCSRLSLGLEEPDLDVRLRFTQAWMEKMGLPDSRATALFLARHCLRLRHIRGVLEQVLLRYEQNDVLPSEAELSALLSRAGAPQPVDCDSILSAVASRYGCTTSELCENTKDSRLTLPRQTAMYLCRELLGESYPSIGHLFGGKDHSTVMYAVRKIEKLKVTNKDMNIQLTELTKLCRNALPRRDT